MHKISNATKKDLPEILKVLKRCKLDFNREIADLEEARRISTIFLVYKDKEEIIGTVRAIFDGYYCILYDLTVDTKFRNQGIAKILMEEAEKKLKKLGAKYIFLNSSDEAEQFYRKVGYTKPDVNPLIKNL